MPDFMLTGYTGFPSIVETVAVLAVTGAAAWVGIRTGLSKTAGRSLKYAGWVGGVGSALLGLLYVGGKSNLGSLINLPAVRVTPS
jgi:Trk-type K+ transport system membrane component